MITPAKYLKCSAAKGISTFSVSRIGLPLSMLSTFARCSLCSSMISAILFRSFARSLIVVCLNFLKASRAARTASFTSSSVASAIFARCSPFAGFLASSVAPSFASRHSPFMKSPYFSSSFILFSLIKIL